MQPRRNELLIVSLALALVAAACGGGEGAGPGGGGGADGGGERHEEHEREDRTVMIGGDRANFHGEATVSGQSLEVELDDFYFEPTVVKGDPGGEVELEMGNEGEALHNLTVEDQGVDQDVRPGGSATVTVTLPSSGQLAFYCKYHRAQGMVGALEAS